jgi:hypothetical protein
MMRKHSSGNDARLIVRPIGTGENALSAADWAASLRKSTTPSAATVERAHTSIGDFNLDFGLDFDFDLDFGFPARGASGEFRNRDSAATNAAASSWCTNSITWNSLAAGLAGIPSPSRLVPRVIRDAGSRGAALSSPRRSGAIHKYLG